VPLMLKWALHSCWVSGLDPCGSGLDPMTECWENGNVGRLAEVISCLAARLWASQAGPCSMDFASWRRENSQTEKLSTL
jgi:hypothetical protein